MQNTQEILDMVSERENGNPEAIAAYIRNDYKTFRQAEYPPILDYLDGVVKGDQVQIDKYISDCQAVKDKYPKGE